MKGVKYKLQDLLNKARELGGQCLADEYRTVVKPIEWECAHGHRFRLRFDRVMNGSWCPVCVASQKQQLVYRKFQEIAKENGGLLLS